MKWNLLCVHSQMLKIWSLDRIFSLLCDRNLMVENELNIFLAPAFCKLVKLIPVYKLTFSSFFFLFLPKFQSSIEATLRERNVHMFSCISLTECCRAGVHTQFWFFFVIKKNYRLRYFIVYKDILRYFIFAKTGLCF